MGRVSDARDRLVDAAIDLIWLGSYGSVTVDAICARADVKKGSFYYFFASKDELVIAALDANWQRRKPAIEAIFSANQAPEKRLTVYFDDLLRRQRELKAQYGHVVGCLHGSIGSECIQQSPAIAAKVQEILAEYLSYYEDLLRALESESGARLGETPQKAARALFAFMEGVLAQARLQDDLALVRDLPRGARKFLGLAPVTK